LSSLKIITVISLIMLFLCMSAGAVLAQDESGFIRAASVSKREAVVLSAIFPGLGQMTQGHKYKGISLFLGEAISMVMFINAHENYKTKQNIYDRDLNIFNSLASYEMNKVGMYYKTDADAKKLYKSLQNQNDDLDNLHTIRNTAVVVAVSVYAFNIFDAIFLSEDITESQRAERLEKKIRVSSVMIDRNPGILLSKRF